MAQHPRSVNTRRRESLKFQLLCSSVNAKDHVTLLYKLEG
jgi:hypothetical protein